MLMLMAEENKDDIVPPSVSGNPAPVKPEHMVHPNSVAQPGDSVSSPPLSTGDQANASMIQISQQPVTPVQPIAVEPKKKFPRLKRVSFKKVAGIAILLTLFVVAVSGAYLFGKKDQKVIIQAPPAQQLNLPPQAVVVAECVKGRGKQYVLPKDIPGGPIYDVVNDKVIAIEYNLNVSELVTNSDNFSNTILRLAKDYPIDHLVLIPIIPKDGGQVENALLVTYVVSKEEAKAITCDSNKT